MRDITWRTGFTLLALAVLVMVGSNASGCTTHYVIEQALGQTPQDQIDQYLADLAKGDRQAALALWLPPGTSDVALQTRRQSVTDELLAYGSRLEHRVLNLVWWRTCCEPAVIDDPIEAGGVRARVAIRGEQRIESVYRFDLLVPGGYWGAAAGYPVREWVIVDIYPESAAPLAWAWNE
jgi:hypothetical protein